MRKKTYFLWLLSSLSLCPLLSVTAQQPMTLDQCVSYAIDHNIDIAKRAVEIEQYKVQAEISENKWQPRVDAEVSDNLYLRQSLSSGIMPASGAGLPNNFVMNALQPAVTASMPLYTGGRLKHQTESDKLTIETASYQLEQARKDVRIQVATYYLQVLYYKGMADVTAKQVELSRELLNRAKALYNEGRRPQSDVAEAEAQLATDQYQLSQDKGNVTLSTVTLAQLLNMEEVEGFTVDDPSLAGTPPTDASSIPAPRAIYTDIVETYPSIMAMKSNILSLQHQEKVYQSAFLPQISARATLGTSYNYAFNGTVRGYLDNFGDQVQKNFNPMIGVSLSYNIFNGRETRKNVRRAQLAIEAGERDLDNARLALRKELQQAYYNATTSATKYQSAVAAAAAAETSYEYNKKKYDAGKGTIFELDQAQQKWVQAQQNVVQSKYDYLIRRKILDFYINN